MNVNYRLQKVQEVGRLLQGYEAAMGVLPGIVRAEHRSCLLEQVTDSIRRIEFVHNVRDSNHDPKRMQPYSGMFDPLKAAALHSRRGNIDEAYWLVFLATHFGKHAEDGWRLIEDVYGKLRQGGIWDWNMISTNLPGFRLWLAANEAILRGGDGVRRRFSNHRKYESLSATSDKGLAIVVESYVGWVAPPRTHAQIIRQIHAQHGQNPETVFGELYRSLSAVIRFGKLGKFDFLTMLGKLGIAPIVADKAYLREATGPMKGARLLFLGNSEVSDQDKRMDNKLLELDRFLQVGMQTLEDSLCNWQKSPSDYIYFRG